MKIKLLQLLTLLVISSFAFAQNRNIGFAEVTVIEMAPNGDVWAGSASEGVAFFNNAQQQWTYYNTGNTPSMTSDAVYDIKLAVIDGTQRSYVATGAGVSYSVAGVGWDTLSNLGGAKIWGINIRPDSIWALRLNTIVSFDSANTFRANVSSPLPSISTVQSSCPCPGMWVGTANNGVYHTENGTALDILDTSIANQKLVDNRVNAITLGGGAFDEKYVATKGGFSKCPPGNVPCQNFTTANSTLKQNDVTDVAVDCKGRVWLATRDSGVMIFTNPGFIPISAANGLPDNRITSIGFDQLTCNAVIGTKDGNVVVVDTGGIVQQILSGVGVVKEVDYTMHIFPQPSSAEINFISEREIKDGNFVLSDINGRTLQQISLGDTRKFTVDIASLTNGMYFYQLYSNSQLVKRGKVQAQR